jgi:hypothetical protein
MNIVTKLNVGDMAFTMYNNKLISGPVESISTYTNFRDVTTISYVLRGTAGTQSPATCGRDECDVYASEEDLLNGSREGKP